MRSSRNSTLSVMRLVAAGTVLAVAGVSLVGIPAASASTLGGTATIVDETSPATGASTDLFGVTLPSGAACTGDSAHDGYYVYSYLIPQGAISQANFATTLTYNGLGSASQGLGLPEAQSGDIWGGVSTAPNTGEISISAQFQWAELITNDWYPLTGSGGILYDNNTSGIWETGIACAKSGVISDYWNTEVTFTASSSDPNGFTWTAVPGLGTWAPEARWAVVLPAAGAVVLGGGWWVSRRRRSADEAQLDVAGLLDD